VTKQLLLACLLLSSAAAAEAADDQRICADRPGKANPSCTVPLGKVQVETGFVDWIHDKFGGVRTDDTIIGSTAFKYGVTDRFHVEVDVTPYDRVRTEFAGLRDTVSGFGDMGVAAKYRLTNDKAPVQIAMRPFVKVPTASHNLGNGKVEGGLAFLIDGSIPRSPLSFALGPEIDVNADSDGRGYHLATVQVVSLGANLTPRLNVSGELWGNWDFDPMGTVRQYSADASAAYLVSNTVQIDAGANFGLNRNTPDIELYTGIAFRF
jgi:hypothetical protein